MENGKWNGKILDGSWKGGKVQGWKWKVEGWNGKVLDN